MLILFILSLLSLQARREPQRGPGNYYCGTLSQPYSVGAEIEKEETWGGVSPHYPTRSLGERPELPGQGPPKVDFMHICGQKEAIWNTLFSILERWRGPTNVAGPWKTFPLSPPPLDMPDRNSVRSACET